MLAVVLTPRQLSFPIIEQPEVLGLLEYVANTTNSRLIIGLQW